ncbi:TNFAIP3-interacting protein 1 isoform X1 [Phycodurus eques]|uniref:TNFAIP3-interacting protein 1 isoform X1 n=1 Tax=Phycodurus eques TaxID=693459 RepID=UPI002ACE7B0D|nr:TNFAIP3-interacting protein 1 isoform X1 [Phycodurus eques]XP_061541929.1 TNFAIP3-interacting protein 1 isoform X1 [Phycodurus eques]XP_061541930.1 TNFAIP3-interacting protein 1 isoform X1 [Phycodurus eques]XP_061541931.1 TNFAIP3-interacting protein 1 isoform X1 [Phycodurus eques]
MEGKGPYRIYDPGGSDIKSRDEAAGGSSYRQLLEENSMLRERMKGLKSLGDLLEESQLEALRLRQRVEELVRDNEALKSSSFAASLCAGGHVQTETQSKPFLYPAAEPKEADASCLVRAIQPNRLSEALSEFEVVNMDRRTSDALTARSAVGVIPLLPQENVELASQLKKLESSFSIFAEESNPNQLLAHLGRMAVEFHHLSSKVQKNEQRTSLLQTLCEQLRHENNELRKKMEEDHHIRNRDLEQLRQENQKLKELVTGGAAVASTSAAAAASSSSSSSTAVSDTEAPDTKDEPVKEECATVRPKVEASTPQKSGKAADKSPSKPCDVEVYEKKIKLLEKQRKDVLEVNKQWDIQWNSMKSQFEQKITDLRQRLADSQKTVLELEAEREQRQRDYEKKLLLAKSKIENVQGEKECLNTETTELKQKVRYLQDQLLPLSKQREYQEKEIQRLNRALEEALNLHAPSSSQQQPGQDAASNLKKQELLTQIAVLKEQVKIFEEDFRKERSDRERMNEEKEDLRRQVERLQIQITNLTNQLHQAQNECQREHTERCKLERLQMQHHKQGQQQERRTSDPTSGSKNGPLSPPYCGPFVQVGAQGLEGWPIHFHPRMPNVAAATAAPPHVRDFQPVTPGFPWQSSSFLQPRGARAVGESSRPAPDNADQSAAASAAAAAGGGFGKRERQNIDPGKH